MTLRNALARVFLPTVLVILPVVCSRATFAQTPAVQFDSAIPFYGGRLIGFDQRGVLSTATATVQPSAPASIFVTIKLEIVAPFAYKRGRFREIELIDARGVVYHYRGWLTDSGWMQIDEPNDQVSEMSMLEAGQYPAIVDLHFEVPMDARSLILRYDTDSRPLAW